jgi:hypothetical protein
MRLALGLALLVAAPLVAQEDGAPVLEVVFEETEAMPGQPLSLRLTVLVPTFMPDPPVWPTLEAPNLLVRLPEGSTTPTSRRIGSDTWSGITRHYRISPMVAGDFAIPPQEVVVTYADPDSQDPARATLSTDTISFSGVVPEGAEGLDPFIAARSLELTQEIDGDPSAMVPGDSVKRTVTAAIAGTSPMFLPDLLPQTVIEGVATYADEPALQERDDRGVVSGTRTESDTFVAEGGGSGEAPPVSVDWFNLETGEVETAAVDGFTISVDGPPAQTAAPRDWRAIAVASLGGLMLLALVLWLVRRVLPPARGFLRRRRERWLASEPHAYEVLQRAVARKDHANLYPSLDDWAGKIEGPDPRRHPDVQSALTALGAARYCRDAGDAGPAWSALQKAIAEARRASVPSRHVHGSLPPLNPTA